MGLIRRESGGLGFRSLEGIFIFVRLVYIRCFVVLEVCFFLSFVFFWEVICLIWIYYRLGFVVRCLKMFLGVFDFEKGGIKFNFIFRSSNKKMNC